ncbi:MULTISPECIES: hypothetical protein [Enterococcus]|uniref:Uncharacterized protein n=1 Tax=Enterococcus asini TaxID=57732 RepID=A0AAW8U128_9ENTE|nr:hypothetical protein [Enterococcus asini]MDT2810621.1 hypothetical protein [Enterococcus asini]
MKKMMIQSKDILMLKYNKYPINRAEIKKSDIKKITSEVEINIGTATSNTDSKSKMYRIILNITESIKKDQTDESKEVLRDFSIKIYYYLKSDSETLSDDENNFVTLSILKDLNKIVKTQTSLDSKQAMNIDKTVNDFEVDNSLSNKSLIDVKDETL